MRFTTRLAAALLLVVPLLPTAPGLVFRAAAGGGCHPAQVGWPKWVPNDLPLPTGTYAFRRMSPLNGYKRAKFVLPVGTHRFARFVLRRWPKHGWELGRGDSEATQVEDDFWKSPAYGAFRADDLRCKTVLYLIFNKDGSG